MKELVILDLDGVIIKGQSQLIFLNYLLKRKIIGLFFYLKILIWFIFYKLRPTNNPEKIMNFSFSFLKNKNTKDVEEIIKKFFLENLHKFIFPEIIDIINKHRARGRELLIISNAADILVKEIAEFLDIRHYIGTKLEKVSGVFTGKISGDIVYGKNKVIFAEDFIKKNGLDPKNNWSYTDHISDLNLLLLTSNPCAVNPDRLLKKEAQKRNWPILIFK